jgi:hypothetical protein
MSYILPPVFVTVKFEDGSMVSKLVKQSALNAAAVSAELVKKIVAEYPLAEIRPRELPLADEDVSLEVVLPLPMDEIYRVRDRIYDWILELQEQYGVLILASAIPR